MRPFNIISKKWLFVIFGFILLTFFSAFNTVWNPPPGLNNAEAIGPFVNNKLPNQAPAGDIELIPTYSNIQWVSPIVVLPFPGTNNLLVVEMDGRFFSVSSNENTSSRNLLMDIQDRAWYYNWSPNNDNTKHGGIQNVAFHPQFGTGQGKDYMYVYYVYSDNDDSSNAPYYDRLSRFTWNGNSFNPNSELIMINQYDTSKGHDGSGLTFGNDGYLYVSVGDEGTQNGAATAHTQKLNDRFRSGVWRIDVDQTGGSTSHPIIRQPSNDNVPTGSTPSYTQGYYIPNDNPWVNPNGSVLEEFYAIGLRQPFRMTNDIPTGNIWIGDVGGGQREEIDLLDAPGYNYEWNYKEGFADGFRDLPNPYIGTPRPPIHDYDRTIGTCVIGGYVYRGNAIPQLFGKYIFADNGTNGNVSALTYTAGNSADQVEILTTKPDGGGTFTGIGSFGYDHNNELFVLKLGNTVTNGKIYRLIEKASNVSTVFPNKLSQTGVFSNLSNLTPVQGVIPYDVNNPLWSAGTDKKRWVAIPNDGNVNSDSEKITYDADGPWGFPVGTVFVKHFGQPDGKKLETRLWIHGTDGRWFGTTYKWNNAGTDADLLLAGTEENITIEGETFSYLFPSVSQCNTCHTAVSGDVLGFRTHQLNKDIYYPTTGLVGNQLETFAQLGFIPNINTINASTSYALGDNSKSLEDRARSYFDSNCSHCHQPEANRAIFDARYSTPLAQQNLINGSLIEDLGINGAVVIAPQEIDKSVLYQRVNSTDGCCAMPPLAKGRIDKEGVQLIANWINSLDADCSNSSSMTLGNTLSDGNFIDGHNPAMSINENDTYTNVSGDLEEVCIVDFNFFARRLGNPVTPFIAKVNGDNNFTILTVGQSRTSTEYNVGNNSFPFSNHSDDVVMLSPEETIAIGFMDAFPDGSGAKIQSVIPAQQGASQDEIWQTYTTNTIFPSLTVGKSPGLAAGIATGLKRSYKFNIGIDVNSFIPTIINNGDCDQNIAIGKAATQSSTYPYSVDFSAGKAIDGNNAGGAGVGSMTHTNFDNNAWWEVDLGKVYQLSAVKLWNRTDCCAIRLSDFHVLVSDTPFNSQALNTTINQSGVSDFPFPGTAGREADINLNRTGRYLRVQLSGTNALQLAEVEIFGCEVTTSSCPTVTLPAKIEAEDFCEQFGVQAQSTGDVDGGENIGYIDAGDYMEYQINVPIAGDYQVSYRVAASNASGGIIQLQLDGNDIGGTTVPSTGGWQIYTTISNEITLPVGTYTLRLFAEQAGWNLNWIEFERTITMDCSENLALGKTATQSSTFAHSYDFSAGNAIDGNNDGNYSAQSMSHTNTQQNAWWEVDLGEVYQLSSLKLWNRTDCCEDRLSNFHVLVSDTPFNSQALNTAINQSGVSDFPFPSTAGREADINLNRTGRYLRVQLSGTNALQLAEVEIFGCEVTTSSCPTVTLPAKIEAEDFCEQFGVQAQSTGDVDGGENIGHVDAGDYMEYQINVPIAGDYQVSYRVAALNASGGIIQLQLNGNNIGSISIPSTGAWQTYTTISNEVSLSQGIHTLRVFAQQAGWNLNWMEFGNSTTSDCNNPGNIAVGKSTQQSSTFANNNGTFGSGNAVDGNNNGDHNAGSMTHTQTENNAWWEIDLGEVHNLSSIKIWNRTNCCADRLTDFHVLVSDNTFTSQVLNTTINQNGVSDYHFPGTAGRETNIDLNRFGRYLRIQLSGINALQLAEVEIFGCSSSLTQIADCQCASGAYSLLVNGSFEETSNPAYNSAYDLIEALGRSNSGVKFIDRHPDTDFPGWFATGGIPLQQGGLSKGGTLELGQNGFLGVPAPDGDVFVEMDGNHHNQIISVTPAQILDWELSHRGRPGTDEITISAGPVGNQTEIAIVSSPNTVWVTHTGQYMVPPGVTQIQFTITPSGAANGDIDSSNLLDNVKICPSNCPQDLNVLGPNNAVAPGLYESSKTISSDGLIMSGSVEYSAGEAIQLMSGFEVMSGQEFNAHIEGCDPNQ